MLSKQKQILSFLFSCILIILTHSLFGMMEDNSSNFGTRPFTPKMAAALFPITIYPILYTYQDGKLQHAEVIECTLSISGEMGSIIANAHQPDIITCEDIWGIVLQPFFLNATKQTVKRDKRDFESVQLAFMAWIHGTSLRVETDDQTTRLGEKPLWQKLTEMDALVPGEIYAFTEWLVAKVLKLGLFEVGLAPLPSAKEYYRMPYEIRR